MKAHIFMEVFQNCIIFLTSEDMRNLYSVRGINDPERRVQRADNSNISAMYGFCTSNFAVLRNKSGFCSRRSRVRNAVAVASQKAGSAHSQPRQSSF